MKRNLCLLALLCFFLRLPAQDNSIHSFALLPEGILAQEGKGSIVNPYTSDETLLRGNMEAAEAVFFHSALLPYIEGLPSGYVIFPAKSERGKRILATNTSLRSLFQLAYSNAAIYYANNRTIVEVADTAVFSSLNPADSWCYESIVPNAREKDALLIMQHDLQRYFPHYIAKIEKRKIPCFALVQMDKKGKEEASKFLALSEGITKAEGASGGTIKIDHLHELIKLLNSEYLKDLPTPVIDETDFDRKVNLLLETDLRDVASLRKSLRFYGLDLVNVRRKMKVLVIRDSDR